MDPRFIDRIPTLINNRFRLNRREILGKGSFGWVFLVRDSQTNGKYAAKVEPKSKNSLLYYEHRILQQIQGAEGFTSVIFFGEQDSFVFLIIDLLGKNVEDSMQRYGKCLPLDYVCSIGIQAITRLEHLHEKGFLHRDIKPENFVFGTGKNKDTLFLIDFGLSKRFIDPRTGKHIPFRTDKSLTGTPRYATANAHLGMELDRKDDLESLCYVLIYLYKGFLPWMGIRCREALKKYQLIGEMKIATSNEDLTHGCPIEFSTFISYTKTITFGEKPNYQYLRTLLTMMCLRNVELDQLNATADEMMKTLFPIKLDLGRGGMESTHTRQIQQNVISAIKQPAEPLNYGANRNRDGKENEKGEHGHDPKKTPFSKPENSVSQKLVLHPLQLPDFQNFAKKAFTDQDISEPANQPAGGNESNYALPKPRPKAGSQDVNMKKTQSWVLTGENKGFSDSSERRLSMNDKLLDPSANPSGRSPTPDGVNLTQTPASCSSPFHIESSNDFGGLIDDKDRDSAQQKLEEAMKGILVEPFVDPNKEKGEITGEEFVMIQPDENSTNDYFSESRQGHGGGLNDITQYHSTFTCSSLAVLGKDGSYDDSGKVFLPTDVLAKLADCMDQRTPMIFQLSNPNNNLKIHVGVVEFSAPDGSVGVPYWIMDYLGVEEFGKIRIDGAKLPSGTYVKFRPMDDRFFDITNPKAVLEYSLRSFTALTVRTTIRIKYNQTYYQLQVVELKPANGVCVVDADMQVEFVERERPPLAIPQPQNPRARKSSSPPPLAGPSPASRPGASKSPAASRSPPPAPSVVLTSLSGKKVKVNKDHLEDFLSTEKKTPQPTLTPSHSSQPSAPEVPPTCYTLSGKKTVSPDKALEFLQSDDSSAAAKVEKKPEPHILKETHILNEALLTQKQPAPQPKTAFDGLKAQVKVSPSKAPPKTVAKQSPTSSTKTLPSNTTKAKPKPFTPPPPPKASPAPDKKEEPVIMFGTVQKIPLSEEEQKKQDEAKKEMNWENTGGYSLSNKKTAKPASAPPAQPKPQVSTRPAPAPAPKQTPASGGDGDFWSQFGAGNSLKK
ncbi:putative Casein kinase I [Blattamonas nauphoetae]|uniref:non-specific serine/threonine protein kinase n=1 Tax=Blattamonas nauphoetae TaxID=2049346 RepID=A0ABQ9XDD3_9EUKA|nr:putative Casein kinase I [Blattamonas nauphoetae]